MVYTDIIIQRHKDKAPSYFMLTWKVEFTARGTFKLINLQWKKGHAINITRPFLHEMDVKNNNHSINFKIISLLCK